MRIIAGSKRGMKLLSPKTGISRPIADRVKESLFSVLYNYGLPDGKIVADLFCGVGSLGLEALSRAALFVTFVEQDAGIVKILNRNIEKARFAKESKVITANAFSVGAPPGFDRRCYELVFVDPPYACTLEAAAGSQLSGLLNRLSEQVVPEGFVLVRTHRRTNLLEHYGWFQTIERRQWGNTAITILQQVKK